MARTIIPDSDVDANSPVTVALMTAMRDNQDWNASKIQAVTAAGTLAGDDNNMLSSLDGSSGAYTYNLPAAPADGMIALFLMTDATNNVTVSGNGNNIEAAASVVFSVLGTFIRLRFDGTIWRNTSKPGSDSVTADAIVANAVGQSEMASSAVGQGELITTTGTISTTNAGLTILTLPGGSYGFYPQVRVSAVSVLEAQLNHGSSPGTSFVTRISLSNDGGNSSIAQQRYLTASPPYDLGDGEIDGSFIFLLINGLGNVVATYQAPDPPWAYNGPTDIRPARVDPKTGKQYALVSAVSAEALRTDDALLADLVGGRLDAMATEMEITQAVKQADMPLIPHPFLGNDLTGMTVVMLDPMHAAMRTLHDMQQAGADVSELFMSGRFAVDNTPLPRAGPPGVIAVGFST